VLRLVFAILMCALTTVAPVAADGGSWTSVDSGNIDAAVQGAIDSPADGASVPTSGNIQLSGWFVDSSAQGWAGADAVQVFAGPMSGGTLLAQGSVGLNRPDVAAALNNEFWSASGWLATVDASQLQAGQDQLSVNLHTPGKGWFARTLTLNVSQNANQTTGEILAPAPGLAGPPPTLSVLTPQPGEAISTTNRAYVISGTATPVGAIDSVQVWLNGEANTLNATFLGEADLDSHGGWSLTFDAKQFMPIDSNLYVYARSSLNGKQSEASVHFEITNRR
jgi:hypothetical protein